MPGKIIVIANDTVRRSVLAYVTDVTIPIDLRGQFKKLLIPAGLLYNRVALQIIDLHR